MIRNRVVLAAIAGLAVVVVSGLVAAGLAVVATRRPTGPAATPPAATPPSGTPPSASSVTGTASSPGPGSPGGAGTAGQAAHHSPHRWTAHHWTAHEAARRFLDGYVDTDGRVVRRDQGGDTVSEGQAYAMLVAVGDGDRHTFDTVWGWTRTHLQRPDGLLAWRWANGTITDPSSAADADLDAARALILAGRAFAAPDLTDAGTRLGASILAHETTDTADGRILLAGSWATHDPYAYNPSYPSPAAFAVLAAATKDPRWNRLAAGSRAVTTHILTATALPPDWAQVHADGTIDPMPGAAGRGHQGVRYGYDAARTPILLAESCTPADRHLAARLRPALVNTPGDYAARDLGGAPLTQNRSVVAAIANAAIASTDGDRPAATAALGQADRQAQRFPGYYGAAWDALGHLMLTSSRLGGCPPLPNPEH